MLYATDAISYHGHTLPCMPYHTMHAIAYHTTHAMPSHTMHAMPYHVMPCHVMPCHAMPNHTKPYHTMHAIPYINIHVFMHACNNLITQFLTHILLQKLQKGEATKYLSDWILWKKLTDHVLYTHSGRNKANLYNSPKILLGHEYYLEY